MFDQVSDKIRACKGCLKLELLREKKDGNIFFTHSIWEQEADLESYRSSELFASTWEKTKAMFADNAEAWTTELLYST